MPIEIKHLTHVYMPGSPFEARALNDICLDIRDGEFIGIIGHTGSGKSTLISYFNGLERAKPGTVFVGGVDLGSKDTDLIAVRRTVGLVFQYPEYQLFEETVEKDIAFGPKSLGLSEEETAERVKEAMRLMHLDYETYRKRSPLALSGGQMRRVIDQRRFAPVARHTVIADSLIPVVVQHVLHASAQARIRDDQFKSAVRLRQDRDQRLFKITHYRFIRRHDHADTGHMVHLQYRCGGPQRLLRLFSSLEAVPRCPLIEKDRCLRLLVFIFLASCPLTAHVIYTRQRQLGKTLSKLRDFDI